MISKRETALKLVVFRRNANCDEKKISMFAVQCQLNFQSSKITEISRETDPTSHMSRPNLEACEKGYFLRMGRARSAKHATEVLKETSGTFSLYYNKYSPPFPREDPTLFFGTRHRNRSNMKHRTCLCSSGQEECGH